MPAVIPERKLSRAELRKIALRHREDPDVMTLLWEIRRLHDLVRRAEALACGLTSHAEDLNQRCLLDQLRELFEDEPALSQPAGAAHGKPERVRPAENEGQRRRRWDGEEDELNEREAKRRAREKRG